MGIGFVFGQLRLVRGGTRGHSSYHGIAPARPSLASLLMSSALALALNSFKVATTQAHASVTMSFFTPLGQDSSHGCDGRLQARGGR